MNNVVLMGRLTKDPDIRVSNNELKVARFSLAVYRIGEGTDFISCVAFGKTAEFIEKYFFKGMKMALNGRIQTGSYQNKDGKTVYTTDVVAERCEFCEKKADNQPTTKAADDYMIVPDDSGDHLPFNF